MPIRGGEISREQNYVSGHASLLNFKTLPHYGWTTGFGPVKSAGNVNVD